MPTSRIPTLLHTLFFLTLTLFAFLLAEAALLAFTHGTPPATTLMNQKMQLFVEVGAYGIALAAAWFAMPVFWHQPFLAGIQWNASKIRLWLLGAGFALGFAMQGLTVLIPQPKDLPIEDFFRTHGRAVYEDFDRKANELWERARKEQDPRLLEEVGRSYPLAQVLPDALLALGAMQENRQQPAAASQAYKRLLSVAPENGYRARALWGLARAYETQKLWVPARDSYLQAQARFSDVVLDELGTGVKVRRLVAERLARPPFDRMASDPSEPSLPLPLSRLWSRPLAGPLHPLSAAGLPPAADSSRIFLVQGSTLQPVDPTTGTTAWAADLGSTPVWVGYLADKILVATDTRVSALSLARGGDRVAAPLHRPGCRPPRRQSVRQERR